MKLWRILLAIYVLVLSGLPCEALCLEESITVALQDTLPASGDHDHDESCSPFCLCATCPGFTLPQPPLLEAALLPDLPLLAAEPSYYQALHTLDVSGRIWQPPRLG